MHTCRHAHMHTCTHASIHPSIHISFTNHRVQYPITWNVPANPLQVVGDESMRWNLGKDSVQ